MSIEEARGAIWNYLAANGGVPVGLLPYLDRLVLEIQASFECELASETWDNCLDDRDDAETPFPREFWCRACKAREELALLQVQSNA